MRSANNEQSRHQNHNSMNGIPYEDELNELNMFLFNNVDDLEKLERSLLQRPGSRAHSVPAFLPTAAAAYQNLNELRSSNQMLPNLNQNTGETMTKQSVILQQRGGGGGAAEAASSRVKTAKSQKNASKFVKF